MAANTGCAHLADHPDLVVDQVLDSHLEMTDGIVHCAECRAAYLLGLVDVDGSRALFRVQAIEPAAAQATLRSLRQGSCDVERARHEVFSLSHHATRAAGLLLREAGQWKGLVGVTAGQVPTAGWRDLPCDGALFSQMEI